MVKRPEYIKISQYKVKSRGHDTAVALYHKYALPVYEELASQGVVIGSGFTVREVTSDSKWTHHAWVPIGTFSALDKIREAFESAKEARSEGEQEEFIEKLTNLLDFDAYRSQILRVVHVVQRDETT